MPIDVYWNVLKHMRGVLISSNQYTLNHILEKIMAFKYPCDFLFSLTTLSMNAIVRLTASLHLGFMVIGRHCTTIQFLLGCLIY